MAERTPGSPDHDPLQTPKKMTRRSKSDKASSSGRKLPNPKDNRGRGDKSPFSHAPPDHYTCNRCNKSGTQANLVWRVTVLIITLGHWIQVCPTNMDPSMDRPPPSRYRCEICKAVGQHFATLCPENTRDMSLTQLRRNAGIDGIFHSGQESVRGGAHHQDHPHRDIARNESRSRSPLSDSSRSVRARLRQTLEYDSYRPREPRRVRFASPLEEDNDWRRVHTAYTAPIFDKAFPIRTKKSSKYDTTPRVRDMEGRLSFHDDMYDVQGDNWATVEDYDPLDAGPVHRSPSLERAVNITYDVQSFLESLEEGTPTEQVSLEQALVQVTEESDTRSDDSVTLVHDHDNIPVQTDDCATTQDGDLESARDHSHSPTQDCNREPDRNPIVFQASDGFYYRCISPSHFGHEVVSMFRGKFDRLARKPKRMTALQMMEEVGQTTS